jgi:hypothetical protein
VWVLLMPLLLPLQSHGWMSLLLVLQVTPHPLTLLLLLMMVAGSFHSSQNVPAFPVALAVPLAAEVHGPDRTGMEAAAAAAAAVTMQADTAD